MATVRFATQSFATSTRLKVTQPLPWSGVKDGSIENGEDGESGAAVFASSVISVVATIVAFFYC